MQGPGGRGTAVGGKTKEGLTGQGGSEHANPAVRPGRSSTRILKLRFLT